MPLKFPDGPHPFSKRGQEIIDKTLALFYASSMYKKLLKKKREKGDYMDEFYMQKIDERVERRKIQNSESNKRCYVKKGDSMKKVLIAVGLLLISKVGFCANPIVDQFRASLVDHVEAIMHVDKDGDTRISLLDSVLLIGSFDGQPLLHIQGGFSGETAPASDEKANWIVGAMLRIDPFFTAINLPSQYEFFKGLEIGVGLHYDFETDEEFASLMVGLAFNPTVKPQ